MYWPYFAVYSFEEMWNWPCSLGLAPSNCSIFERDAPKEVDSLISKALSCYTAHTGAKWPFLFRWMEHSGTFQPNSFLFSKTIYWIYILFHVWIVCSAFIILQKPSKNMGQNFPLPVNTYSFFLNEYLSPNQTNSWPNPPMCTASKATIAEIVVIDSINTFICYLYIHIPQSNWSTLSFKITFINM